MADAIEKLKANEEKMGFEVKPEGQRFEIIRRHMANVCRITITKEGKVVEMTNTWYLPILVGCLVISRLYPYVFLVLFLYRLYVQDKRLLRLLNDVNACLGTKYTTKDFVKSFWSYKLPSLRTN